MEVQDFLGIVPEQFTGEEIIADATTTFNTAAEADQFYESAKMRLIDVNDWHAVAGILDASFQLHDATGQPVSRTVQQGDYFRIDIPGPGSSDGGGYDWVQVEAMREVDNDEVKSTGLRVRPTNKPNTGSHIAHFYDEESTSTFMVSKKGCDVFATIVDRNIKPNDDGGSFMDQVRHAAIAFTAIGVFSKAQWQSLANGIVKNS